MSEESRKFTGFSFRRRTYVLRCIPFGTKVAETKFTRGLRKIVGAMLIKTVKINLDDILPHSSDGAEHLELVKGVLGTLEEGGVTINPLKCRWLQKSVRFLGHTHNEHQINMKADTSYAIVSFRTPKSKNTLQLPLGLCNWNQIKKIIRIDQTVGKVT